MAEDYVTYELAVKLKEKGFDRPTLFRYDSEGKFPDLLDDVFTKDENVYYRAPNLYEVLKWLREEKGMEVYSNYNRVYKHWTYIARAFDDSCYNSVGGFKSYEQAALAGIEYTLDKLI